MNKHTKPAKRIQIFVAGKHTDMSGAALSFSESDLAASAQAYDPALHEAPLVIGHPKHDAPAYGWVASVFAENGSLEIVPDQVDPEFAEMHAKGRFKKRSASFYRPDSPNNPKPGVYYLKHVGFLGAQPPAIKGLKSAEFLEAEEGIVTVEFGESERWAFNSIGRMLRNVREWMIEKSGRDEADKMLPEYAIQDVEQASQEKSNEPEPAPSFSEEPEPTEPTQEENGMSKEEKAALEKREADLKAREDAIAFAEKQQSQQSNKDFVAKQIESGKLLPVDEEKTLAFMEAIGQADTVEFGEGDDKQTTDPVAWFKEFVERLPNQVEFGEVTQPADDQEKTVSFAAPQGYQVDANQMELHQKAVAYSEKNGVGYEVALNAVNK